MNWRGLRGGCNLNGQTKQQLLAPVLAFLFALVWAERGWAILDLEVQENLVVYEKASTRSREVTRLTRGDKVVVSPKIYGSFRKVLVSFEGRRKGGYVLISSLSRSQIVERGDSELKGKRVYTNRYSLGIDLVGSFFQQGARNFTTSSEDTYEISALKSTAFFFSIYSDIPWNNKTMLRPYFAFRSIEFKGAAELKGAVNSNHPAEVSLNQKLFGVGLTIKKYGHPLDYFWYGGGLEMAEKTSTETAVEDGSILQTAEDHDKSILVLLFGTIGWQIPAPGSIWISPHLRIGFVPNSDPKIYFFETFLGVSYNL